MAPPHQSRHQVYPPTIRKLYATADVEKLSTSGEIFTLQLGSTMTIDLCIEHQLNLHFIQWERIGSK